MISTDLAYNNRLKRLFLCIFCFHFQGYVILINWKKIVRWFRWFNTGCIWSKIFVNILGKTPRAVQSTQDEISYFSRLSGGLMATERWRERWFAVATQSPFSRLFQWILSQWPFLKNEVMPNEAQTRDVRIKVKIRCLHRWIFGICVTCV